MNEDRKPLRYTTNGIVAIKFCKREEFLNERTFKRINDGVVSVLVLYLGQFQCVNEIH